MKTAEEAAKEFRYKLDLSLDTSRFEAREVDAMVTGFKKGFESRQSEIERLEARCKELEDAIRVDQTGQAKALSLVIEMADGYRWITEGRGPYTYDDNEYRKEAGYMIDAIINIARPALIKAGIDATAIINKKSKITPSKPLRGGFAEEP